MGCSLKVVFIIGILQYLENCQFSPGSSTNDDKILKITKELNQIIANFKVKPFYMFQENNIIIIPTITIVIAIKDMIYLIKNLWYVLIILCLNKKFDVEIYCK